MQRTVSGAAMRDPDGGGLHATIGRVSVFDERPTAAPAARRWPIAVAAILLAVGGAVWLTSGGEDRGAGRACTDRAGTLDRARPGRASPQGAPPNLRHRRRSVPPGLHRADPATPAPPAAPRADAVTLVVESDVPGASVFVDRQFVGTAPVTLKDLAPGAKRINLSADGFDGISRSGGARPGRADRQHALQGSAARRVAPPWRTSTGWATAARALCALPWTA